MSLTNPTAARPFRRLTDVTAPLVDNLKDETMSEPDDMTLPTQDGAFVTEPEFYLVWTRAGHMPRYVHGTRQSAETEAIRLAKLHPGHKFIVLAATKKFWVSLPPGAERAPLRGKLRYEPEPTPAETAAQDAQDAEAMRATA